MENFFGLIAIVDLLAIYAVLMVRYFKRHHRDIPSIPDDQLPPMPKCRRAKRVRVIDGGFVAIDDIKTGDFVCLVEHGFGNDDLICYGDDGQGREPWGASFKDHIDGSGCQALVCKGGVRYELGKFESATMAIKAAIEKMEGSTSPLDVTTVCQLKVWLAEEIEKVN